MSSFQERKDHLLSITPIAAVLDYYNILDNLKEVVAGEFRGRCPFHSGDNSSSFVVRTKRNECMCYAGCGIMNGFDVVRRMSNMDPGPCMDLLRRIASGVKIEDRPAKVVEQEPERPIVELKYMPELTPATAYLLARKGKIREETGKFFGLGIARYGTIAGRLVVPVRWDDGMLVGYAHRSITKEKEESGKYILSRGTPRGGMIYNLHRQRKGSKLIVVEGYMDVAKVHQAGFPNVVAICGVGVSKQQAEKLDEWASKLLILFDPDEPGSTGAAQLHEKLKKPHRIVALSNSDPGDMSDAAVRRIMAAVGVKPTTTGG